MFKAFGLTVTLISFFTICAAAQAGNDFMMATELMNQGEYEEAYEIFERLLEEEPGSYPVFDRAVTTLVNLKRYDEAIGLTEERLNDDYNDVVSATRLGELYYVAGDTARANEIWRTILEVNTGRLQAYRHVAHAMQQRRAYSGANKVYRQARETFNQPDLFGHEIAHTALITGDYETAMQEFLALVASERDYIFQVQRQLMRFDEPYLLDVAIMETEDKIDGYRNDSRQAASFRELLVWLYMERELYRRALTTARNLESSSAESIYAVYNLGDRLRTQNEYELAESAYTYYTEQGQHEMKARSLEQLARVYMSWAEYLENHNLDFGNKTDSLYRNAEFTLNDLNENHPHFSRRGDALLLQAELALDHLKDVEKARRYHSSLQVLSAMDDLKPQSDYLEGRIYLYNQDFNRARIAFTQSNRGIRIGSLADKTRYYLALTDFYSGDYDFSQIQLRALERQNTSFFANNALQLRLWIQEGLNDDSATAELSAFSEAHFHYHVTGDVEQAMNSLSPLVEGSQEHPLNGEAVLLATTILQHRSSRAALQFVDKKRDGALNPASMERIVWTRARLADHVYFDHSSGTTADSAFSTVDEVMEAYEDLLVEYPQGFYAEKARKRIQDLSAVTN
ncbi:MAG: tetratricopeptide repeat protein [Balneolales bacterium]